MRKLFVIALAIAVCIGLAGCISIKSAQGPGSSPGASLPPVQKQAQAAPQEDPAATAEAPDTASVQNSPTQGAARFSGITAHYPWERVPLPEGSGFVKVMNVEDTDKYLEYTYVTLPMTKTEAIGYFRPLLEKDAEFFTLDDDLDYPPLEIQGAYPDVASFASLYSRYTQQAEANIGVIIVNLYTSADKETVLVAEIQVNYLAKP